MKQKLLQEGGNLILRGQDESVIAAAEKIDFTDINRREFLQDFRRFFIFLNRIHEKKFGNRVWENESGFYDGTLFNGSARFLFDDDIPHYVFKQYKPAIGDIDATVPREHEKTFKKILSVIPHIDGEIVSKIRYIGEKDARNQVLFLFEYDASSRPYTVQVDFEFTEYGNDGRPTFFERFVHSAHWEDVKSGLKGSLHKILLQSIAKGISRIHNAKIRTPKLGKVSTAKRHQEAAIYSFSVPNGLRVKYEPEPDGSYRFVPFSEAEKIQNVTQIFFRLFKSKPSSKSEIQKFASYVGCMDLMKKYLDKDQVDEVFRVFLLKTLHQDKGMTIDRRMSEDQIPKENAFRIFFEKFPFLKDKYHERVNTMQQVFYNTTSFEEQGDISKTMERYL